MPIHSQLLNRVTGWLPIRPFNEALTGPLARHTGADWRELAVLAAWGRGQRLRGDPAVPLGPQAGVSLPAGRARAAGQPFPCSVTPCTLAWKVPEESVGSRVNQTST